MWELSTIGLENKVWEAKVGLDINDPAADAYNIVHTPGGLYLTMNSFQPYGGWLAKHVEPLLYPAEHIEFQFTLMIDDAIVAAQVIEVDSKITYAKGVTYDLSAQINVAKGWAFEIDEYIENPDGTWKWTWTDTGIRIPPMQPYEPEDFTIEYEIDDAGEVSSVLAITVSENRYEVPPGLLRIPGKNVGWAPSEIVTQLQQCCNANPGGYALLFNNIGYVLEVES